ncbi:carboxypeptidase-like regulatory domain-containing protein [uncultured Winogradskyella sp.]|uniref:carboxypeptidase-like regulatory domain-containing protein n=1 Tax=uncultured Winogradskyella sp. TaxID=395353 RepID=UPI00260B0583|nr:carboxypeptidase-like regulatory domain-containing protein [uncultured Winogradskyella sp.]
MPKRLHFAIWLMLVAVFSCEDTIIEDNIRVLVHGSVVDQNTEPITNASIKVYADADAFGADRVLLGEGVSDASGNFNITSLFGPNELFLVDVSSGDQYSTYRYQTNTEEFTPNDLTFNIETVELKALSSFTYNIIRESGEGNTLQYNFTYFDANCIEIFEEGVLDESQSYCNSMRVTGSTLNNLSPNIENRSFIVPLQSQVEFTYSLNEGEEVSEIITINSSDYAFEFSY